MLNIVQHPFTTELFADDGINLHAFDGAPYARPSHTRVWPIVGQAASVAAWIASPGDAHTYYGALRALVIYPDGRREAYQLGETITWLDNWVVDMRRTATVSVQWIAAYGDRNVARAQTKAVER